MLRILSVILIFFAMQSGAIAQKGTIRGNVFNKDNGEPISFCNILITGESEYVGVTDFDGYYSISGIEAGTYELITTYLGYDTIRNTMVVKPGSVQYFSIELSQTGITLSSVDITGRREQVKTEVNISTIQIAQKQILAIPSTGGEADIAQYLPVLPGIIQTGDQGGQIYIRGGSPIQNKILLDGLTIYNPFHSIGFFSVFETEAIRNIDVLTGGFNAEHGGRISAIVDINTKEGNRKNIGGILSASPFMAKALVEGPIIKYTGENRSSMSFLLTGKHSYLDKTSKKLYSYATDESGLPYSFTDLYGKVSVFSSNGSKLDLFAFNFDDRVNFQNFADLGWNTKGLGANFRIIPLGLNFILDGKLGYTNYDINLEESDNEPRSSNIQGFQLGFGITYFTDYSELKFGIDVEGYSTDFTFLNPFKQEFSIADNTTDLALFLKYKLIAGPVIIEPGLRMQYYGSLNKISPEPRVGLKWNINDWLRLKVAGGIYSQNLLSAVNERDIVNLFVGFISTPTGQLFKPGSDELANDKLQRARHLVSGLEIDLGKYVEINVEPYFKEFTQLININRNKRAASDPDFSTETGDAYGVDFSAKYSRGNYYVWATYSWSHVNRDDGYQVYPTIFDRRHNVNFMISRAFGKRNTWEAALRWNFGTGFPFTQTQGFYGNYNFGDGINRDYLTQQPDLEIVYADERNGGRLPTYHRLDASLKKEIKLSQKNTVEFSASVTNLYDRRNIFYINRVTQERIDQLPILPSLSVKYKFNQ